ncbi:hypothetical protein JB92DRAFT_2898984, partial [Gautieria morchelliformis]
MDSANLNDRPQKGDGDSEIVLVVGTVRRDRCDLLVAAFGNAIRGDSAAEALLRYVSCIGCATAPSQVSRTPRPDCPTAHRLLLRACRLLHTPRTNTDETTQPSESLVVDTLLDKVLSLWEGTAKTDRDIFTEVFIPAILSAHPSHRVVGSARLSKLLMYATS